MQAYRRKRIGLIQDRFFGLLLALFCLALALNAGAATLTVTSNADDGGGSLRRAIAFAVSGDAINFAVTGTIALTSGTLLVENNLTIIGPGAEQLAVIGLGLGRR